MGRPPSWGGKRLLRPSREDGDVLAGLGVDPFEGQAVGVEVPEQAGHGGGDAGYRVPGGSQGQGFVQSCPPPTPGHAFPLTQQPGGAIAG